METEKIKTIIGIENTDSRGEGNHRRGIHTQQMQRQSQTVDVRAVTDTDNTDSSCEGRQRHGKHRQRM